ncbi:MAG TPA: TetR/AcrR family transcriptional regulator [Euzebya sp.]|nr:TetR/AcrR family transcriptional regulator [Euzebya sp.]
MTSDAPLSPHAPASLPQDGRRAKGIRTRDALLTDAVQMASVEGLEGLTIARLAERIGAAKSSVHAAFGSKQALQLAAIERTREMLIELVIVPALAEPPGLARLSGVGQSWFRYLADDVFEGGCLLCSASAEMDGRPGATRDAVAAVMREWLRFLADNVTAGIDRGELVATCSPDQLAFELHAIGLAANWHHQLFGGPHAFTAARNAWTDVLARHQMHPARHDPGDPRHDRPRDPHRAQPRPRLHLPHRPPGPRPDPPGADPQLRRPPS